MDVRIAAPKLLWPGDEMLLEAQRIAARTGATLILEDQPRKALAGADFVYTDVWVSMGEPDSVWAERIEMLKPFQVNAAAMAATGNPRARFMHCLPAFHDLHTEVGRQVHERFGLEAMEVTDEVFESDASIVFTQAENRMHTIKAVLVATLGS
jgi:ornithine carbamoyltransferase